jgi:hypothetical protein
MAFFIIVLILFLGHKMYTDWDEDVNEVHLNLPE